MNRSAYIAIDPKTRMVVGAVSATAKDSKGFAEFVAQGLVLDRVTAQQARDLCFNKLPDSWDI